MEKQTHRPFSGKLPWFIAALVFILGGLLCLHLKNLLRDHLRSPEFRQKIEMAMTEVSGGTVRIGQLEEKIGLNSWIAAHGFEITYPGDSIGLKADYLRVGLRLIPLLKRKIEVTHFTVQKPALWIRRPKGKSWPTIALPASKSPEPANSHHFPPFEIEDAHITMVDENVSKKPVVTLDGTLTLYEKNPSVRAMTFSGQFETGPHRGDLDITGSIRPELDFRIAVKPLPLYLVSLYVPALRGIEGNANTVFYFRMAGKSPSWRIEAQAPSPALKIQQQEIPMDLHLQVHSTGTFGGSALYKSTSSAFRAEFQSDWQKDQHRVALQGDRLTSGDVQRIVRLLTSLPSSSTPGQSDVQVDWKFKKAEALGLQRVIIHHFIGSLHSTGKELQFNDLEGEIAGGSVTAHGTIRDSSDAGGQHFSADIQMENLDAEPVMFALSTNPVLLSGRMSGTAHFEGRLAPWSWEKLTGHFSAKARAGDLRMDYGIMQLFQRLNLKSLVRTATTGRRPKPGLPFDEIAVTGQLTGTRATIATPLTLTSPTIELAFSGWTETMSHEAEGTVVVNALTGTRNLLHAIPVVSKIVVGKNGEFVPLVVDLKYRDGELKTDFRSGKTLTSPALRIIGNTLRLPETIYKKAVEPSDK